MLFNSDRCEARDFGKLSQGRTYKVNGRILGVLLKIKTLEYNYKVP